MTEQTAVRHSPVATGTYEIDQSHSMVEFVVRHLMVTKVRGRFGSFSGTVDVGEEPEASSVRASIDASSIHTGDDQRDGHLRSADFFDVENHPTVDFVSTGIQRGHDGWDVAGDLTIRGVTRPVRLDVELGGSVTDPWGGQRIGLTATTEIDREDWGLTWNQALESGGVVVGKKIRIELAVEAVRAVTGRGRMTAPR